MNRPHPVGGDGGSCATPDDARKALIQGDIAAATIATVARAQKDGTLASIEVVARKRR